MKRSLIEHAGASVTAEGLRRRLELLASVAKKAIALGKYSEAERLLASATAEFVQLVDFARSHDELEEVARIHAVLSEVLPALEAGAGKPWAQCLEFAKVRLLMPRLPPRGQA